MPAVQDVLAAALYLFLPLEPHNLDRMEEETAMKFSEVMALEAGPETNALVAEKVMGREVRYVPSEEVVLEKDATAPLGFRCNFGGAIFTADRDWLVDGFLDVEANREVLPYSTDIAAAWEVLERINKTEPWALKFVDTLREAIEAMGCYWLIHMRAEDVALAICRAALMTEDK